jgi:hypothetical protein
MLESIPSNCRHTLTPFTSDKTAPAYLEHAEQAVHVSETQKLRRCNVHVYCMSDRSLDTRENLRTQPNTDRSSCVRADPRMTRGEILAAAAVPVRVSSTVHARGRVLAYMAAPARRSTRLRGHMPRPRAYND